MTTKSRPFPRVLRIEPASECNLSCSHCPTGTVEMAREVMSEATFAVILKEIEEHRNTIKVIVLYHGGEPLLNKLFFDMVQSIKAINAEFYVKTVSNGMGLTEKNAKRMIESGIDSIEFSLDGTSAEESQKIRIKSNTDRILGNIHCYLKMLRNSNVDTDVFISTTQFVRSNEVDPTGTSPEVPDWLRREFSQHDVGFKTTFALKWPHMGNTGQYDYLRGSGEGIDSNECDHVLNTLTVRSDGSVVPCCYDLTSRLIMGKIGEDSLMNIWNGPKYTELRDSIETEQYISICSTCAVVKPPIYLIPKWDIPLKQID